jgi:DNA-binding NtrC family response regulator
LKGYLNEDGFAYINTASNGEEAIDVFNREVYDIVIVDIFMPKRHGIDVLKHVKSVSPSSQVIIVTAKGAQKTVFEAFRLGAFDYIEKPFKYDWLSNLIKKAMEDKVFLDEKKESF